MSIEARKCAKGRSRLIITNSMRKLLKKLGLDPHMFDLDRDKHLDIYIDGKYERTVAKIDIYNASTQAKKKIRK